MAREPLATGPEEGALPPRRSLAPHELARAGLVRGRAWVRELGLVGLISLVAALAIFDFALAIVPWASVPLSVVETALVVPWIAFVLRGDTSATGTWLAAARARVPHFVNIGLLALTLAEKWHLLVMALAAESPDAHTSGYRSLAVVALVLALVGLLGRGARAQAFLADAADHPARLMVLSFGVCSFLGAFLLSLPAAVHDVRDLSLLDGLFTAVSAVCVTGLVVNDVAETYAPFGEIVILVLSQIGALGIMALSASFAVLAGRKLRVKQSAVLTEMIDAGSLSMLRRTLLWIVGYTLVIELVGAVVLYALAALHPEVTGTGLARVYWAVFHSISAFCNAGFVLMPGSLSAFATSWPMSLTFGGLIVLGGLGFPVIDELRRQLWERMCRRRAPRLSLHARVVLATSAGLVFGVALVVLAMEWGRTLAHLPWHGRVLAAVFQSVTMRSGGFNTIDVGGMHAATLLLTCIVMFIGASPGSAGGGIKTTTFAALFAEFRAELRGHPYARLFDRQVSDSVVRRATGVLFLSLGIVSAATFVLLCIEDQEPLAILFEIISAFATVGLSMGATPELSPAGRVVVIVVMFVGRIGPMTMALAMASEVRRTPVRRAVERIMIG